MENKNNTLAVIENLNENIETFAKVALINLPDGTSIEKAKRVVLKEFINFEMACTMKPELANPNIDRASIYISVKQAISDNLTLSPHAGLVYLMPGKVCIGMNGSTKIYKDVLTYSPTAEGEISMARQSGTILDHKRPTVKFDGTGDVDTVTFEFMVPAHPEPRWESVTFDKTFFAKLKQKSAAKFGNANPNYTSWNQKDNGSGVFVGTIDPEFAASKAIKHGLKKRGRNSNEVQRVQSEVHKPEVKTENIEHTEVKTEITNKTSPVSTPVSNNDTVTEVTFEEVKTETTEKTELTNDDLF